MGPDGGTSRNMLYPITFSIVGIMILSNLFLYSRYVGTTRDISVEGPKMVSEWDSINSK